MKYLKKILKIVSLLQGPCPCSTPKLALENMPGLGISSNRTVLVLWNIDLYEFLPLFYSSVSL